MSLIIRPSSLTSYADCPRRTAARAMHIMVEDAGFKLNKTDSSIGAVVGTGTHAGVAHLLTAKMERGQFTKGDESAADDCSIASLREESAHGVLFDKASPNMKDAEQQVRRQVAAYRIKIAPHITPIMVEKRLEASFGPFTISGGIDVAADGVRDLKTGTHHRMHMPQLGTYKLLIKAHGIPCNGIIEDYVPRGPMKELQRDPISTEYDAALSERVAKATIGRMARDVLEFQKAGDPMAFAANPGNNLCSPKYCPAFGTPFCEEHLK